MNKTIRRSSFALEETIPGAFLVQGAGVLVGSRIRPWRIFTFGSVAVREGDVVCRQSSNSILALLGSLPLRLASVVALTVWILTLAYLWPERGEELLRVVLIALPPTFYLAASGYLSFRSPRKGTLLVVGILINATLVTLAILCYGQPGGGYVGDLPKVLENFPPVSFCCGRYFSLRVYLHLLLDRDLSLLQLTRELSQRVAVSSTCV